MKKKFPYLLWCYWAVLSACFGAQTSEWLTKTGTASDQSEHYQIALPDYLLEIEDANKQLNPQAVMQYANHYRNAYMLMLDTSRSTPTSMAEYAASETRKLVGRLQKPQQIDSSGLVINGLPAVRIDMTGDLGNANVRERIYYRLIFVETPYRCVQLVYWTWDKWRDKYLPDIEKSQNSFELIDGQTRTK